MKLDYYLDGARVDRVVSSVFSIRNSGGRALVPSDFYEKLKVQAIQGLEIIGINTLRTLPAGLSVTFTEQPKRAFVMEPVLLNPGDEVSIGMLIDASKSSSDELYESPLLAWSARIRDVASLESKTIDEYPETQVLYYTKPESLIDQLTSGWLIVLTAYSAPAFFGLVFLFSLASTYFLRTQRVVPPAGIFRISLLILFFIFSVSTSEIIIFYLFGNEYGIVGAHTVNALLIGCHALLFIIVALIARKVQPN
jgi:hypothetical protein